MSIRLSLQHGRTHTESHTVSCTIGELAQDVAQESCAIVVRRISGLRSTQAFNVWFYRIVLRESLRAESRRCDVASVETVSTHLETTDPGKSILRIDVMRALAKLPSAQRAAIVLHFYADMNSREIADVLHMPDSSVRFHIMNAKHKLELLLSNHGNSPSSSELSRYAL